MCGFFIEVDHKIVTKCDLRIISFFILCIMGGQHHVIQGVDMQHYSAFDEWLASTALGGSNQSYIEELYERYLEDRHPSVDEELGVLRLMHCRKQHRSRATTFTSP